MDTKPASGELARIERAIRTPEYQTYAAMAGAAIAGALFAPTKAEQEAAFKRAAGLQAKMAQIVARDQPVNHGEPHGNHN